MAFPVSAKWEDKKLQGQMAQMEREGRDTKPVLKQIGAMMVRSPQLNWKAKGKRYQAGGWDKLSPYTLAMRRWNATAKRGSGQAFTKKILEVKGDLRRDGWSSRVTGSGDTAKLEAGTNNPHAEKHHKGGWFAAPPGWARPMVKVPQRILIAIAPDDMKRAEDFADRHLKKAVPGAR